jgi:ureidoacrylate peracid hydrolase
VTACLLVIDMQNGFCHPDGSGARAGLRMWNLPAVIDEHVQLVAEARGRAVPVVFTRYRWRRNRVDIDAAVAAVFGEDAFGEDTWDAAIVDAIAVGDDTVVDKPRFDSFLYTDLDLVLRRLGVDRLLLTGVTTNGCVETTARTATQLGYDVVVAEDATSAREHRHRAGLASIDGAFGTVEPWRSVMARW